jgi:hypothetical protein
MQLAFLLDPAKLDLLLLMSISHFLFKSQIKALRYSYRAQARLRGISEHQKKLHEKICRAASLPKLDIACTYFSPALDDVTNEDCFSLRDLSPDTLFGKGRREPIHKADLHFVKSPAWKESALLFGRAKGVAPLSLVWMLDSQHSFEKNYHLAAASDIFFPGQAADAWRYKNPYSINGGPLHGCCLQWSRKESLAYFERAPRKERSSLLYGGFYDYGGIGGKRNQLIRDCQKHFKAHALTLRPVSPEDPYTLLSKEERFRDWMSYKASLALPIDEGLPCRTFDALLTGQVPIVPLDSREFDDIISMDLQKTLPVVRLEEYSFEAVDAALAKANCLFDEGGLEGEERRHLYAAENHMEIHRLRKGVTSLKILAEAKLAF